MAKRNSLPLTDDELKSVYRDEFYSIDDPRYFAHWCTGGNVTKAQKSADRSKKARNDILNEYYLEDE